MEQYEARLLAGLAAQVAELVRDGQVVAVGSDDPLEALVGLDGPEQAPEDPVLQRLLPDAYREDPEAAADFRRFTEPGLRDAKARHAQVVIDSLVAGGMVVDPTSEPVAPDAEVEVALDADQVQSWLRSLTDIRLSLATRLGIDDDEAADEIRHEDGPDAVMADVYDWLGFVQETLVLVAG